MTPIYNALCSLYLKLVSLNRCEWHTLLANLWEMIIKIPDLLYGQIFPWQIFWATNNCGTLFLLPICISWVNEGPRSYGVTLYSLCSPNPTVFKQNPIKYKILLFVLGFQRWNLMKSNLNSKMIKGKEKTKIRYWRKTCSIYEMQPEADIIMQCFIAMLFMLIKS